MTPDAVIWKDIVNMMWLIITGVGVPILIAVLMRRQSGAKVSIEARVDTMSKTVDGVNTRIDDMRSDVFEKIEDTETKIVAQFHDLCHERQGHCQDLQDAKVRGVCTKVDGFKKENDDKWKRQEAVNDKLEQGLLRSSLG